MKKFLFVVACAAFMVACSDDSTSGTDAVVAGSFESTATSSTSVDNDADDVYSSSSVATDIY